MAYTTQATGIMRQLMTLRLLKKVPDVDAAIIMQRDLPEMPSADQSLKYNRFLQDMSVLGQVVTVEAQNSVMPLLRAMGSDLSSSLLSGDITKEQYVLTILSALNLRMQNTKAFHDFQEELRGMGMNSIQLQNCGIMTSFFTQPKFRTNYPILPLVRRSDLESAKKFLKVNFKVVPNAGTNNGVRVVLYPKGETLSDALHTLADVIACLEGDVENIELRPSWSLVLNMLGQEVVPSKFQYGGLLDSRSYNALTSVFNVVDDRILSLVSSAINNLLQRDQSTNAIPMPLKVDFDAKVVAPINLVGRCREHVNIPSDQYKRGALMLHDIHRTLTAMANDQNEEIPASYESVELYDAGDLMTKIDRLMRISLGIPDLANALSAYVYDGRKRSVTSSQYVSELVFPLCLRVLIAYTLRVNVMVIYVGAHTLDGVVVTKTCDTDITLCLVVGPYETASSSKTVHGGTRIENVNAICIPEWLSNGICPGMKLKTDKIDSRTDLPLDVVFTDDRFDYRLNGLTSQPKLTHNAFRAMPINDLLFDEVPELRDSIKSVEELKRHALLPRPQPRLTNELQKGELEQYACYHRNWLNGTNEIVEGPIPMKSLSNEGRENAAAPDRVFYCPSDLKAPITGWKNLDGDDMFQHMAASMPQRIACSSGLYGCIDRYQLNSRAYYIDEETGLPHACDVTIFAMNRNKIVAVVCYRVFSEKIWLSAVPRGVFVVEHRDEMDIYCRRVEGDLTPWCCTVEREGTEEAVYCFAHHNPRGRGVRIHRMPHSLTDRLALSNGIPLCVRDSMAPRSGRLVQNKTTHRDILASSLPAVDCCTLDEEYRVVRFNDDGGYKYSRLGSRIKDDVEVKTENDDVFVTRAGELGLRYAEGFDDIHDMMRSAIKYRPELPMHRLFVVGAKVFLPCGYVTSVYNPMLHRHKCVRALLGLKSNDAPSCTNCGLAYESRVSAISCCKKDVYREVNEHLTAEILGLF
uniref:p109 n=1 Tax=Heliothis armigera cypovirus 14 TaxID=327947 RepID=Q27Q79_9REOV|nr:P109 [Heliothis armigera cypovirus 14]